MRIRFETTMDDLIAFNRFHAENSPMLRRQRLIFSLLFPLILCIVGLVTMLANIDLLDEDPIRFFVLSAVAITFGLPALVGLYFLSRWRWMSNLESMVQKIYAEGNNQIALGWREMEIVGNRLLLKTEWIDSSTDLRVIEKIVGNDDFTFVYIASNQAYLIPMNLYPEDEYRQFVADLREAWENRDEPRPEDAPPKDREERITELPE